MQTSWRLYAAHRARLTGLLIEGAPAAGGQLALLGAGRCRDVDLGTLARRFAVVRLVDINAGWIAAARAAQPPAVERRIALHGGIDIGGFTESLSRWKNEPPDQAALQAVVDAASVALARRVPPCDVVASTCLMSQLWIQANRMLGADHVAAERIRTALLTAHLRALVTLCRPGGVALLVNDVAFSPRGELEARMVGRGPRALVEEIVACAETSATSAGRGTSPRLVEALAACDAALACKVERLEAIEPWLWTRTSEQTYLVYAVRFRLRAGASQVAPR